MSRIHIVLAVTALFLTGPASAALMPVVIDFEELPPGQFDTPLPTKGFVLDPALSRFNPAIANVSDETGPSGSGQEIALCLNCGDDPEGFSIYRQDGTAFELDSFDLAFFDIVYPGTVTGHYAAGGMVTQATNSGGLNVFGDDWVGLDSLDIVFTAPSSNEFQIAFIDDVSLQAVPIPAAAWLFASALAGLGWLRRRRNG